MSIPNAGRLSFGACRALARPSETALCNGRIGRRRCHHQDAALGLNVGRRNRNARKRLADYIFGPFRDKTIGHRDTLLRFALVIAQQQFELVTEDAALRINLLDGEFDTGFELKSIRGLRAGQCARRTNLDVRGECGCGM